MSTLLILTGIALAYSGLGALSSTMDRHYGDLHGRGAEPSKRSLVRTRLLGWSAIAASFAACIASDGWHVGPVLWCGALTASAFLLTLLLRYAPRHALGLSIAELSIAGQAVARLSAGPAKLWHCHVDRSVSAVHLACWFRTARKRSNNSIASNGWRVVCRSPKTAIQRCLIELLQQIAETRAKKHRWQKRGNPILDSAEGDKSRML